MGRNSERVGSRELNAPVRIAVVTSDVSMDWVAGELEDEMQFKSPERRRSWRMGKIALKRLLHAFGLESDTRTISFPHPPVFADP